MRNFKRKWWLAAVVICCLSPAAFAHHERGGGGCDRWHNCPPPPKQGVPEGGSTAVYLLGAGLTCFGAMFLRSRVVRSSQS